MQYPSLWSHIQDDDVKDDISNQHFPVPHMCQLMFAFSSGIAQVPVISNVCFKLPLAYTIKIMIS